MTSSKQVQKRLSAILETISADIVPRRQRSDVPGTRSIGVILDDFSMQCFRPEGNLWPIAIRDMEMALDRLDPELLLIESAWNGNEGDWLYQITSPTGPKEAYFKLIQACRDRSIPTVFWNKEDPPHFQQFLPAASMADHIFTCEESLVGSYKAAAGHSNVNVMRFAAQPRLHVPFRSAESRKGNIAFAGQYFAHKFPERREQMQLLFPAAARLGLSIYSRVLDGDPNYAFPEKYEKYIVGSLPYSAMVKAYRDHKVFLNVNSVPESKSMCARRIFELSSSKTAVVSVGTTAITSSYADDEVFTVNTPKAASKILETLVHDNDFRERATHRSWRRTLGEHTYENRLAEISQQVRGVVDDSVVPTVAICLVSSVDSLSRLLHQIRLQLFSPTEVLIVPTVSGVGDYVKGLAASIEIPLSVVNVPGALRMLDMTGKRVAIFSEAFDYAPHYLSDLILYSKHLLCPDIVAKAISGDVIKDERDYVGQEWPEDIETKRVLSGAWISPGSCEWREMVMHEIGNPGTTMDLNRPVRAGDRFNIRRTANGNNNSWIV